MNINLADTYKPVHGKPTSTFDKVPWPQVRYEITVSVYHSQFECNEDL